MFYISSTDDAPMQKLVMQGIFPLKYDSKP